MDVTFQSLGFKLMISLFYSFLILLLAGTGSSSSELFFYDDVIMKRSFVYVFELPDEEEDQTYEKTKSFLIDLPKEINIRMASFLDNHSLLKLSYSSKSLSYLRSNDFLNARIPPKMLSFFPKNTPAFNIISANLYYFYGLERDNKGFIKKAAKLGYKGALKNQQQRKQESIILLRNAPQVFFKCKQN